MLEGMNVYELRLISDDDDRELGLRVASALYAENKGQGLFFVKWRCREAGYRYGS